MKQILVALFADAAITYFCSVQLPSANADEAKTFIGKIESARPMLGKPPKWTYAKFTAIADNGEKVDIYMLGATVITDVAGKAINGSAPKKNKKVDVKYSTAGNGRNEAISIHYLD